MIPSLHEQTVAPCSAPWPAPLRGNVSHGAPVGSCAPDAARTAFQSVLADRLDRAHRAVPVGCLSCGEYATDSARRASMSPEVVSVTIIVAIVAVGVTVGFLAR